MCFPTSMGSNSREIKKTISGGWFQPLWKIWKSVGMIIPNIYIYTIMYVYIYIGKIKAMFRTTNQISLESMVPHCRAWHWAAQHVQRDRRHNVGSPWTHQWTDRQSLWPVIWGWLKIGNAWECHNLWPCSCRKWMRMMINLQIWVFYRLWIFQNPFPSSLGQLCWIQSWATLNKLRETDWFTESLQDMDCFLYVFTPIYLGMDQYLLIPFFRGMNIHLPAILMFTRGTRFWHTATSRCSIQIFTSTTSRV